MYIRIQKREELLSDGLSKLCKSRYELTGSMRFHFHNFYRTLSIKKLHSRQSIFVRIENKCLQKIEKQFPETSILGTGNKEGLIIYAEENDTEK